MQKAKLMKDITDPDAGIIAKAGDIVEILDKSELEDNGIMVQKLAGSPLYSFYVEADEIEYFES